MNGMVFFNLAVLSVQQLLIAATGLDNPGTECFHPTEQLTCLSTLSLVVGGLLVCAGSLLSFLFVLCLWKCCFKQHCEHGEAVRPDGPCYPDGEHRQDIRTPIQEEGSPYPMQFVC